MMDNAEQDNKAQCAVAFARAPIRLGVAWNKDH